MLKPSQGVEVAAGVEAAADQVDDRLAQLATDA